MNSTHTRFYRDKQNGKFMGVCAGIADYTGIDVMWVRIATVLLLMMGTPFIFMAYMAIGFFAEKRPAELYVDRDEQKFWQSVRQSPRRTTREVRNKLRDIDRRMADVETYYVSGNAKLADEIERLR